MRKTQIVGVLLVVLLLLVGACAPTPAHAPAPTPEPQSREFTREFFVPMTGLHVECFDFSEGDRVEGEFTVDGQYTVDLSVIYAETLLEGGKAYSLSNCILETGEALQRSFSFVAPVSSEYAFFFAGFYADKVDDGKPYEGLHETVTLNLYITVNP